MKAEPSPEMAARPGNTGRAAAASTGRPQAPKPRLSLSLQYAVPAFGLPGRAEFRRWIAAALQREAEITVRIVDEAEGRALNRDFRGRDYATNVLTFVYSGQASVAGARLTGDIALCAPVVAREAHERNIAPRAHYAHLAVHGALHLQGYDHEADSDAEIMEASETATLAKLGFPDPYADEKRRNLGVTR